MSIAAALDHMISGRYSRDSRYAPERSTGYAVPTDQKRDRYSRDTLIGTGPDDAAVPTVPTGFPGGRDTLHQRRTQQRRWIAAAVPTVPTVPTQLQHVSVCAANADPIDAARARGWHVELRPAGLLIDTQGQPSDLALMERLHVVVGQEPAWPAHLLSDPGEVVLRGELDLIEREPGR
ncbi:hypothetical protein [Geminicoccus harenae]|uniref:hypothetical protein n=1 Tax=Geminicoccus harenae TaxID=2498453 RepID=UPI00168B7496|nr:hypothetical protein [Geminicoccus harenae]